MNTPSNFQFSENLTQNLYEDAEKVGADIKGFALWPSVQLGDNNTVSLQSIRNMIFSNPVLPDEWAPEVVNHITCILDAKNELKRSTNPDKFDIDWDKVPFSKDEHGKYAVERIRLKRDYYEKDERYAQYFDDDEEPIVGKPVVLQVNHMEKHITEVTDDNGDIIDRKIDNYEYDDGIHIVFVRTHGNAETDDKGTSKWQLAVRFKQSINFGFGKLERQNEEVYEDVTQLLNIYDNFRDRDGMCSVRAMAEEIEESMEEYGWNWQELEHFADRGRDYTIDSDQEKIKLFKFMDQEWQNRQELASKKARYMPFIRTLKQRFQNKRNEQYSSKQVREVLKDILVDKIEARSIRRGLYFVIEQDIEKIESLRKGFRQIDERIRIPTIPITEFEDAPALNQGVETVREGLFEDLFEDLQNFLEDLQERDGDDDTRPSTWSNREQELIELYQEYQDFVDEFELDKDVAGDMFEEAKEIIDDNMAY